MDITSTSPWQWQDHLGFSQAVEIKNTQGMLYCSGQAAMDADGRPLGGDMSYQIVQTLKNIETVIAKAGYNPEGIVRLNFYTTSIPDFFEAYDIVKIWMKQYGIAPSSTLLEVSALAFPGLSVEIEATVAG